MLVAISGSQGSGKTTILNELEKHGCPVVKRKTSRSILDEWGYSLEEVNSSFELTVKFQEEITKRKHMDEFQGLHSPDIWFTERTHADLFTYALVNLGKSNEYSDWLNDYYRRSMLFQTDYSLVFYLSGGRFHIEHDGVRGSNQHYGKMIDLTMFEFTKQMTHSSKLNVVGILDKEDRVNLILTQSKHILYTNDGSMLE